jgi:hypothetical protein
MHDSSLMEHFDLVVTTVGLLGTGLLGALIYIFNGMRSEIRDLKGTLEKISDELFQRVHETEMNLERLWAEHRVRHEGGN